VSQSEGSGNRKLPSNWELFEPDRAGEQRFRQDDAGRESPLTFHDGRHTSITNAAAAGTSPAALMARAGHSDFKTTRATSIWLG
jgi:integrase